MMCVHLRFAVRTKGFAVANRIAWVVYHAIGRLESRRDLDIDSEVTSDGDLLQLCLAVAAQYRDGHASGPEQERARRKLESGRGVRKREMKLRVGARHQRTIPV